jgi:hypothetical protein
MVDIQLLCSFYIKVFGAPLQLYKVTNLNNEDFKHNNSKDAFAYDLLN